MVGFNFGPQRKIMQLYEIYDIVTTIIIVGFVLAALYDNIEVSNEKH